MNDPHDNHASSPVPAADQPPRKQLGTLSDRVRSLRLPDKPIQPKGSRSWLPWALCLILVLTTGYFGVLAFGRPAPDKPKSEYDRLTTSGTRSDEPAQGEIVHESKGYVIPAHQIQISPKVGGIIVKLCDGKKRKEDLKEGDLVDQDEVLALLEDIDYKADRDRAQGYYEEAQQARLELVDHRNRELDQLMARWNDVKEQCKQLELDRHRNNKLKVASAVADRDFEVADSAYLAMVHRARSLELDYDLLRSGPRDNKIKAAEKRIHQAKADLTKAQWRLDGCTVRAPEDKDRPGKYTILEKKAEKGDLVNPAAYMVAAYIFKIANLKYLEVGMDIQERDIAKVRPGQLCRIRLEAFPDHPPYEGKVSRLMPIADRAKGSIPVRVEITNPDQNLKPEMGAVVSFLK